MRGEVWSRDFLWPEGHSRAQMWMLPQSTLGGRSVATTALPWPRGGCGEDGSNAAPRSPLASCSVIPQGLLCTTALPPSLVPPGPTSQVWQDSGRTQNAVPSWIPAPPDLSASWKGPAPHSLLALMYSPEAESPRSWAEPRPGRDMLPAPQRAGTLSNPRAAMERTGRGEDRQPGPASLGPGCHNRAPAWALQTSETDPLPVPRPEVQTQGVRAALPPRAPGEGPSRLVQLLVAAGNPGRSWASGPVTPTSASMATWPPPCVCVRVPSSVRTLVPGLRPSLPQRDLNLTIMSAESLLPSKVRFVGPRVRT